MNYVKRKSAKQEAKTAKEFGGRVTPASGALDGAKGDVKTSLYLIENKFTDNEYYKFDLKTWEKIFKEATKDGLRIPLMQIDIQDTQLVAGIVYDVLPQDFPIHCFPSIRVNAKSIRIDKFLFERDDVISLNFVGINYSIAIVKKDLFLDGQMQT